MEYRSKGEIRMRLRSIYTKVYELVSLASLLTIAVFEKGTSIKRVYHNGSNKYFEIDTNSNDRGNSSGK